MVSASGVKGADTRGSQIAELLTTALPLYQVAYDSAIGFRFKRDGAMMLFGWPKEYLLDLEWSDAEVARYIKEWMEERWREDLEGPGCAGCHCHNKRTDGK